MFKAPGDLWILQAFANTFDHQRDSEDLSSPSALSDWLSSRGLFDPATRTLDQDDLDRALAMRQALRRLLAANRGAVVEEAVFQFLDRAAAGGRFQLRLTRDGARFEGVAKTFDDALARLVAIAVSEHGEGNAAWLKVCASDECRTVFYDVTKAHRAKWCTSRCGVKLRVRTHRRHRAKG